MPRSRSRFRRRADLQPRRGRDARPRRPPEGRREEPVVRRYRRRRHRPRGAVSQAEAESSGSSPEQAEAVKKKADSSKWICGTCGGPHRTKECPVTGGAVPGMGMMMGMMMPAPGMSPMGMPGMAPFPGMPGGETKTDDSSSNSGTSSTGSEESEPEPPPRKKIRTKAKDEKPVGKVEKIVLTKVEEVEKFMIDNKINEEAALKVRALSPSSQRTVIARQLTGDVQDPSKVMITRVRAQIQQKQQEHEAAKASKAWNNAMKGASTEAVDKYIKEKELDEGAAQQLRSLPPQQQAVALRWDLSGFKNPSAKFMSMAAALGQPPKMGMPMMGMPMMGMPPVMGMPPPGMMGMHPGMPPMGMHPGMPGMPGMPPMPPMARMAHPALPQKSKPAKADLGGPSIDEL